MTPGQRVLDLRKERGLSQRELANLAQLPSAAYVSRYETGTRGMQPEMLKRVATVLGTTDSFILSGADTPAKTDSFTRHTFRINGRPRGRSMIQVYPETSDTIHYLSRAYGLTTPELMGQMVNHCLSCIEV